ncbi:permease-like cell division protein FtsX [Actinoplanes sp. NEAU-A12]|uniref:Permease-like cell division protein FtsX n=1 Tax=Actinoplanes sandaracinus TaxID=3045177 RepID=A0ABT6WSE1_9ACTN|nr:permease-like cell division protein FtsX [Actinoplanes sandaracinus]MDI6102591.1 permease-like cell division protein FtsX [Actinoplanes sandaracinus]
MPTTIPGILRRVRRFAIIIVALLQTVSLAACGLFQNDEEERLESILKERAYFTVFMLDNASDEHRTNVQARLQAIPGVSSVVYEDGAAFRDRFRREVSEPTAFSDIDPNLLPAGFVVTMLDQAAIRQVRDSALEDDIKALPGVRNVLIRCTTVEECNKLQPSPMSAPS